MLHEAERVFFSKARGTQSTRTGSSIMVTNAVSQQLKNQTSSSFSSVTDVEGLLPIARVKLSWSNGSTTALALCDTTCSQTLMTRQLADRLKLKGNPIKVTVNGINAQETVYTDLIELKVSSLSGQDYEVFTLKLYVKRRINVGSEVIVLPALQRRCSHLAPLSSEPYSYANVELVLSQDAFAAIHLLEYFVAESKNSPIAVRLPLGWVLSGPLPSTTCILSTCFKAIVETENLTEQIRAWYDIESFGAFKHIDPRSAADSRALKILEETTFHHGERCQGGMLWATEEPPPESYFAALVQLKSLEKCPEKDVVLKENIRKQLMMISLMAISFKCFLTTRSSVKLVSGISSPSGCISS